MLSSVRFRQKVESLLQTRALGRTLVSFEEIDSTNTQAMLAATTGTPHGTVYTTESQTAGRGRMGRTWMASPGENLTFSILLRPSFAPYRFGLITVAAGLAVAEALDGLTPPARPAIKWPNDIQLDGRKVCGMLLESSISSSGSRSGHVVLGIGLNVNQVEFPEEIATTASSLRLMTGKEQDRPAILAAILLRFEQRYEQLENGETEALVAAYEQRLAGIGQTITLRFLGSDRTFEGVIQGVDASGGLRLWTPQGEQVFHSGEVTTNPLNG